MITLPIQDSADTFEYEVPEIPINIEESFGDPVTTGNLVKLLRCLVDGLDVAGHLYSSQHAAATGLIRAVAMRRVTWFMLEPVYEVTELGMEFLRRHEAPEWW